MAFLAKNGSDLNEFIRPGQEAAPRKEFLGGNENLSDDWYNAVVSNISTCQRWSQGHKARGQGQGQGHKKIRSQEQPFRGQTLSRPRTEMLEAKDQGHKRKCSPKKRSSPKFIRRSPEKNVFQKNFWRSTKF